MPTISRITAHLFRNTHTQVFDKIRQPWRSFEEVREWVRASGIKSKEQWSDYSKAGKLPSDIPSTPDRVFKGKGWVSWPDFLGTDFIHTGHRQYRSFEKAREWARASGIKSGEQWAKYGKEGKLSSDIPRCPDSVYKENGWVSWPDFLGTDFIHTGHRQYRSFEKAREWARASGIKSSTQWRIYIKEGKLPSDIPRNPNEGIYKGNGWVSWPDFLGTDFIHPRDRQYRSFEEAREWARASGIKSSAQWVEYSKSGKIPPNIPSTPNGVYKGKGWVSWPDFLGTDFIHTGYRQFKPFEEAREWARASGIKSSAQWGEYSKSGKLPLDIPSGPNNVYKGKGWRSWSDWLDTDFIHSRDRQYRSFEEAREWARASGIKSGEQWVEYSKSGKIPPNIPSTPNKVYKGKGWRSWSDWLDTDFVHPKDRQFKPFEEAREWARSLRLKSYTQWKIYSKGEEFPRHIPRNPHTAYKGKGWVSWSDFLGTENVHPKDRKYKSFEEAREWARVSGIKTSTQWKIYGKEGKLPSDIPCNSANFYKGKGWVSWPHLLGTDFIHPRDRQFKPFKKAREYARSLGLKNRQQWNDYSKAGKLPSDIPGSPSGLYKGRGWTSWPDFLGTDFVHPKYRQFKSFEEAREWARNSGIKTYQQWMEFRKAGKLPPNIPSTPNGVYRGRGWVSWPDFLGTDFVHSKNRQFKPFEEAREWARASGIKSSAQWGEYSKAGKLPLDMPRVPAKYYKKNEWVSWSDFLGTDFVHTGHRQYRSFEEAREYARSLKLRTKEQWFDYIKLGKIPTDIPRGPSGVYKGKGWVSWPDFLKTGNV